MDCKVIIEAFDRIEQQNGGLAKTNPQEILDLTAKELGIEIGDARSVMVDHWSMTGSG